MLEIEPSNPVTQRVIQHTVSDSVGSNAEASQQPNVTGSAKHKHEKQFEQKDDNWEVTVDRSTEYITDEHGQDARTTAVRWTYIVLALSRLVDLCALSGLSYSRCRYTCKPTLDPEYEGHRMLRQYRDSQDRVHSTEYRACCQCILTEPHSAQSTEYCTEYRITGYSVWDRI